MLDARQLRRAIVTTAVLAAATAPTAAARTDTPSPAGYAGHAIVAGQQTQHARVPARVETMGAYNAPVVHNSNVQAEPIVASRGGGGFPWSAAVLALLGGAVAVAGGVAVSRRRAPALAGTPRPR